MSVPSGAKADSTHTQHEDNPWTINIVDHPGRAESHWFSASKRAVKKILATLDKSTYPYGPEPWQMHHGGSIWVLTDAGWRMYLARAGIEWSMQFCADPAKIDRLRQEARALVEAFPRTIPALEELGYTDAKAILEDTISDADGVGRYTDSLFNSCVPLSPGDHEGTLPKAAGEHYYPIPIKAGDFVRYDDFVLWVTLDDGTHAAVAPVARRGSHDGRVELLYARHGTNAGEALTAAIKADKSVIVPPDHPAALAAFQRQR